MNSKRALTALLLLAACGPLAGQDPQLRLKSKHIPDNWLKPPQEAEPIRLNYLTAIRRATTGRLHYLIQFSEFPASNSALESTLEDLGRRDVRVLRYMPDDALLVSAPEDAAWDGLSLHLVATLQPGDKLSELFSADDPAVTETAVLTIHDDVDPATARLIATESGLEVIDNPDLPLTSIIVRGPTIALHEAASWDETYYIFPASSELQAGLPQIACLGGAHAPGLAAAADLATSFGDGWDGPGLGSASLTYYFGALTAALPGVDIKAEIRRALDAWSAVVKVNFTQASAAALRRSIDLQFASGSHGDGFSFDSRGGILAHTFYPPPNSETIAGDLHFDNAEPWKIGADVDLFSVALHELGHSLGLGHSDDPNAVMYPYYRRVSGLRPSDIAEIRRLYAAAGADSGTPTQPPTDPVQPPTPPTNPPAPTPPPTPDRTAPTLKITTPSAASLSTNAATLTIAGTANDNVAVTRITAASAGVTQAEIPGAAAFTLPPIRLYIGLNTITIKAYDAAGNTAARTISVTRR